MSDLSDKKPAVTESATKVADLGAPTQAPSNAVRIWAVIGGAILILQLYVWTRWITGPYFERVPGGPSDPPLYMKIPLILNMVVVCVGFPSHCGGSSSGRGCASAESRSTAYC